MKIQTFCPMAVRVFHFLRQETKLFNLMKANYQAQYKTYVKINIKLGFAWAFLWPAKKIETTQTGSNVREIALKKADDLFESGHYEECYNILKDIDQDKNVEIFLQMTRALYNMSKQPKYTKDEQKSFVLEAFTIISNQLQDNWDHFAVQKWYALILDSKSSYDGISERIKQLENVKKHMDLAVTLNPDDATTLFMLGEWCYQITEMPWHQRKIAEVLFATPPSSTYEDALEYFLRAEAAQPRFYSVNLLRLGSCYLKLEKEDQARYYLKLAASYPAKSNDDHLANKEAAELLKMLK